MSDRHIQCLIKGDIGYVRQCTYSTATPEKGTKYCTHPHPTIPFDKVQANDRDRTKKNFISWVVYALKGARSLRPYSRDNETPEMAGRDRPVQAGRLLNSATPSHSHSAYAEYLPQPIKRLSPVIDGI